MAPKSVLYNEVPVYYAVVDSIGTGYGFSISKSFRENEKVKLHLIQ